MIGKLKRVPLHEVWPHEALDFTKWLEDNIDVLNEVIDQSLSSVERERSAGDFRVDLVAEDESGNLVIIENQLEKSDHDHLGKLITYLTAIGAKTAIWIVADPRPEHVGAISWLNESSSASFYLVKVEAVRIEDSPPAPLLTLIVGPSEEGPPVVVDKERHIIRHRFWTQLLERAKQKTKLHTNISPSHDGYIGGSAGKRGLGFWYTVRQHDSRVGLYIDRGTDKENQEIFDVLAKSKVAIETEFGGPLEWGAPEGMKGRWIRKQLSHGGYRDKERWPEIQDAMIDAMIRLEKAFRPYIDKLPM
ncbi:DUF4268 domain-containing protein [Candidatus Poribacteria bacterium]|nr:DUF4268 domain-containing protein [Candidatus Poribacteria bacterium]